MWARKKSKTPHNSWVFPVKERQDSIKKRKNKKQKTKQNKLLPEPLGPQITRTFLLRGNSDPWESFKVFELEGMK